MAVLTVMVCWDSALYLLHVLHFGCAFTVGEGPLVVVFAGRNAIVLATNAYLFYLIKRSLAEATD